jgi:hypothetical protein
MNYRHVLIGLAILAVGFYLGRNMPMLLSQPLQPQMAG